MTILLVSVIVLGFVVWTYTAFLFGFMVCARDAERRLKHLKPVDTYWRRRGMQVVLVCFVLGCLTAQG